MRAAENAERDADEGGDQETPEDRLDALPKALMQPQTVLIRRRRGKGGVEGFGDIARRRQIDGIARQAGGRVGVVGLGVPDFLREACLVHPHAGHHVVDIAGIGNQHVRMPEEGHVADGRPQGDGHQEGADRQDKAQAAGERRADPEPLSGDRIAGLGLGSRTDGGVRDLQHSGRLERIDQRRVDIFADILRGFIDPVADVEGIRVGIGT